LPFLSALKNEPARFFPQSAVQPESFMSDDQPPEPPPVEGRKSPRRRVLLRGKVLYNEGAFTVDCRIRDMSDGGARILLPDGQVIPTRVILLDMRDRIAYECEVAWFRAPEYGVKFLQKYSLRGDLPPTLMYLKGFA